MLSYNPNYDTPSPPQQPPSPPPPSSLHQLSLLLHSAELISSGDTTSATTLLHELLELSSPFGSPPDRITSFFSHSLLSHLLSLSLHRHNHHPPPLSPPPPPLLLLPSLLSSFHSLNSLTPLIKFSHFTSNQAIFQTYVNLVPFPCVHALHVIDLDIMQGLQWPGLFHLLASHYSPKPPPLRLTAFGPSMALLTQTGQHLAEFASSLGLPFQFTPLEGRFGDLGDWVNRLGVRIKDVTVVHWMHHRLYDISGSDEGVLKGLCAVRPRLVTMVEQDMTNRGSFLDVFVEALHYYSALFDALGEGLGGDSVQRHMVEQQLFGCEIRNILAPGGPQRRVGGSNHNYCYDGVYSWRDGFKRVGFVSYSLAGSPAAQASLLLAMFPWKGYTLVEDKGCLRLGWKDLPLLTASAWEWQQSSDSNN